MLSITKAAGAQLRQIAHSHDTRHILFYIQGGGCNGFKYYFRPLVEDDPSIERVPFEDIEILVDTASIFYVLGTTIDWKDDIMGKSFRFKNPNADTTCGCDTSFSVK